MKRNTKAILIRLLILTCIIGFTASCEKEKIKDALTITIDATALNIAVGATYYIVLSDESGVPILYHQMNKGDKLDLKPPNYSAKTLMITQIKLYKEDNEDRAELITYTGIPAESTTWTPTDRDPVVQAVNITFSGATSAQSYTMSTNREALGFSANFINYPMTFKGSSAYLFGIKKEASGNLKYRMFTNNNNGYSGTAAINLTTIDQNVPMKPISIPPGVSNASVSMTGMIKTGPFAGDYLIGNRFSSTVPDMGSVFEDYGYSFVYSSNNYNYITTSVSTIDFSIWSVIVNRKLKTGNSITYSCTGTQDYEAFTCATDADDSGAWFIYTPPATEEHTITIPKIPEELVTKWKALDRTKYSIYSFSARDITDVSGYDEFLKTRASLSLVGKSVTIAYNRL